MTDLNTLIPANSGWVLNEARGINDTSSAIVGWGQINGQTHAFLTTDPPATPASPLTHAEDAHQDVNAGALLPYASTFGITGLTSGGFISVQNLMNAANSILALDPRAIAGDPNQAFEAALAQVFQSANLNSDFVQQELLWNLLGSYPRLV